MSAIGLPSAKKRRGFSSFGNATSNTSEKGPLTSFQKAWKLQIPKNHTKQIWQNRKRKKND